MKIAIPYNNGEVFGHFGKAEQFKIYTVNEEEVISSEIIDTNGTGHGALADFLKENSANMVICGGIGAGAVAALEEAGIQIMGGASGEADKQVAAFLNGQLHFEHAGGGNCSHHACHGESGGHENHDDDDSEQECDGNIPACGEHCCH